MISEAEARQMRHDIAAAGLDFRAVYQELGIDIESHTLPWQRKRVEQMIKARSTGKAPSTSISLRFCPACGRTDRFTTLKDRHYARSQLCDGVVEVLTYRLDKRASTTLPASTDTDVEELGGAA